MAEHRHWSVTTLIDLGLPKQALIAWAANATADYAIENLELLRSMVELGARDEALETLKRSRFGPKKKASERGTSIHSYLERRSYGEQPAPPEGLEAHCEQVDRFLAEHNPRVHAAEAPVYSGTWSYAGTLDLILELPVYPGRLLVADMKTTDKLPGVSRPPYPEVALQLAAYRNAEYIGLPNSANQQYSGGRRYYVWDDEAPLAELPQCSSIGLALIVSPADYTLTPVRIDGDVFRAFLDVRNVAMFAVETSKRVLGPPILPSSTPATAGPVVVS
jgi:hypothetical protein